MDKDLCQFKADLATLKRFVQDGQEKPHKLILLLAVMNLADVGELSVNEIYFSPLLIQQFRTLFSAYAGIQDWCQPSLPFFHLRTANFWHHKIKSGREEQYAQLKTSGGGKKRIEENIDFAFLSDYAFRVVATSDLRDEARKEIIEHLSSSAVSDSLWQKITSAIFVKEADDE